MAKITTKSFDSPDETRSPDKATLDVVDLGGTKAMRMTAQPGWRWSECIKPVVGGESRQNRHIGVVASGALHIVHDDGTEVDVGPADAYIIEPGHDAWVVGNDPFVAYEFESTSAATYGRPST